MRTQPEGACIALFTWYKGRCFCPTSVEMSRRRFQSTLPSQRSGQWKHSSNISKLSVYVKGSDDSVSLRIARFEDS